MNKLNNKSGWSFSRISSNRGILIGIATLFVLLFHAQINGDILIQYGGAFKIIGVLFYQIKDILNIGVDMFLFLSGFGLYYSINKNHCVRNFYQSRVVKVIIPAIIESAVLCLFMTSDVLQYFFKISMLSFWVTGDRYFWYIALLIVLYIVFPLINKLLNDKPVKWTIALIISVVIVSVVVFFFANSYFNRIEIALTRIPVFMLGSLVGKFSKESKTIPSKIVKIICFITPVLCVFVVVLDYILTDNSLYFLVRYSYVFLTFCLIIFFSELLDKTNVKSIKKVITFIGKYSLELYLGYTELQIVLKKTLCFLSFSSIIYCLAVFLINLLIAILFKFLYNALSEYILTHFKRKKLHSALI